MRLLLFFLFACVLVVVIPAQTSAKANKGELFYNDNTIALYMFQAKGKWGISDASGKIITPALYYDKPSVECSLLKFPSGYHIFDYYTLSGKLIAKNAYSVKQSKVNRALHIVESEKGLAVFRSGILIVPYNKYTNFTEFPYLKRVLALTGDKQFLLGENFEQLSKPPVKYISTLMGDTMHFVVTFSSGKTQLCDKGLKKISAEYDKIEPLYPDLNNKYIKVQNVGSPPLYGVLDLSGKPVLEMEWNELIPYESVSLLRYGKNYVIADSLMRIDRSVVIDSVKQLYTFGLAYKTNGKWKLLRRDLRDLEFEDLRDDYHKELLSVKRYGKWGVYNFANKKWAVPSYFDSIVHFAGYGGYYHTYTTKMGSALYVIDQKNFTLKGSGYDVIESLQQLSDIYSDSLRVPNYVVNRGGKMIGYNPVFIGGRSGIMNEKGDLIHSLNGDVVIPLRYVDTRNEITLVKGLLWNCGGTAKAFKAEISDSVDVEAVDENGNFFMKRIAPPAVYEQQIIGGKFGIVDVNGKEIFPVAYDDIKFGFVFGEGYSHQHASYRDSIRDRHTFRLTQEPLYICKNGKWGLAQWDGTFVIDPMYDSIEPARFDEKHYYRVYTKNAFGYADSSGKAIIPVEFSGEDIYYSVTEEPWVLFQKGGRVNSYRLIGDSVETEDYDQEGNLNYRKIATYRDQLSLDGGTYGFFNAKYNKWIFEPLYQDIVCIQYFNGKPRRLSVTGQTHLWKDNVLETFGPAELKKDGKWAFANFTGKITTPFIFDSIGYMINDRLTQVWQNGSYGYNDTSGKLVVAAEFKAEEMFAVKDAEEELILLQKGGSVSTYTIMGHSVQTFTFDEQGNEYAVTYTSTPEQQQFHGGQLGFFDLKTNTWALEAIYDDIRLTHSFHAPDSNEIYLKTSVTDKYRIVCDHIIQPQIPLEIKKDGKWGMFKFKQGMILKPEYDEIRIEGKEIIAKQAGVEKRFDFDGKPK
jgi:hypothetical protein